MKSKIKYILLFVAGLLLTLTAKSQTVNDVGIIWEQEATMPAIGSTPSNTILLTNGNYLLWGYRTSKYTPTQGNDLMLIEYTETGTIIRQQTIPIFIPNSSGRTFLTHPQVIETTNGQLLALMEFNDGSVTGAENIGGNYFTRVKLTPNLNSGYGGNAGWQVQQNLQAYQFTNHSGYGLVTGIRILQITRAATNLLAAGFTAIAYPTAGVAGGRVLVGGVLYLDNNGDISTDPKIGSKNNAFKILFTSRGATTKISNNNGKLMVGNQSGDFVITNDIYTASTSPLAPITSACSGCVITNYGPTMLLFNDKYFGLGHTALHLPPTYLDQKFQVTGWKWNIDGTIQTSPNPFFRLENTHLQGNPIKINETTVFSAIKINCTAGSNAACIEPTRIAQLDISNAGVTYSVGNPLNSILSPNVAFYSYSHLKDGIMSVGKTYDNTRFVVAKISLCENYQANVIPNTLALSGVATTPKAFITTGAFAASSQTYKWEAILRKGKLGGIHSAAGLGDVIASGADNNISAITLLAADDEGATVEVVYTGTQRYGTNNELNCSTVKSYNIRVIPDIKENQSICSGNTPAQLTGIALDNATYQWQQSTDNGTTWANAQGASTTQNYNPPALTAETKYRRVVTSATEGTATSNAVTVSIYQNPTIEVVAMPNTDDVSGKFIINTSLKNIGGATFISPFKITVYKDNLGNAVKYTYIYAKAIASNETVNFEIEIPNFETEFAGVTKIIVNFNDNGDGGRDQVECDQTVVREYEINLN